MLGRSSSVGVSRHADRSRENENISCRSQEEKIKKSGSGLNEPSSKEQKVGFSGAIGAFLWSGRVCDVSSAIFSASRAINALGSVRGSDRGARRLNGCKEEEKQGKIVAPIHQGLEVLGEAGKRGGSGNDAIASRSWDAFGRSGYRARWSHRAESRGRLGWLGAGLRVVGGSRKELQHHTEGIKGSASAIKKSFYEIYKKLRGSSINAARRQSGRGSRDQCNGVGFATDDGRAAEIKMIA